MNYFLSAQLSLQLTWWAVALVLPSQYSTSTTSTSTSNSNIQRIRKGIGTGKPLFKQATNLPRFCCLLNRKCRAFLKTSLWFSRSPPSGKSADSFAGNQRLASRDHQHVDPTAQIERLEICFQNKNQ